MNSIILNGFKDEMTKTSGELGETLTAGLLGGAYGAHKSMTDPVESSILKTRALTEAAKEYYNKTDAADKLKDFISMGSNNKLTNLAEDFMKKELLKRSLKQALTTGLLYGGVRLGYPLILGDYEDE